MRDDGFLSLDLERDLVLAGAVVEDKVEHRLQRPQHVAQLAEREGRLARDEELLRPDLLVRLD